MRFFLGGGKAAFQGLATLKEQEKTFLVLLLLLFQALKQHQRQVRAVIQPFLPHGTKGEKKGKGLFCIAGARRERGGLNEDWNAVRVGRFHPDIFFRYNDQGVFYRGKEFFFEKYLEKSVFPISACPFLSFGACIGISGVSKMCFLV